MHIWIYTQFCVHTYIYLLTYVTNEQIHVHVFKHRNNIGTYVHVYVHDRLPCQINVHTARIPSNSLTTGYSSECVKLAGDGIFDEPGWPAIYRDCGHEAIWVKHFLASHAWYAQYPSQTIIHEALLLMLVMRTAAHWARALPSPIEGTVKERDIDTLKQWYI